MATTGSVKAKIQGLIDKSNAVTMKEDTDLTSAVDSMVDDIESSKPRIAYGDTAPEDTTKLWVKTSEPSKVIVSPNAETITGEYEIINVQNAFNSDGKSYAGCASFGSKIYVFAGQKNMGNDGSIYRYNADDGTFTKLSATINGTNGKCKAVAVGNQIYVFIGSYVWQFDTDTESVTMLTSAFGVSTASLVIASDGLLIYFFGSDSNHSGQFGFWNPTQECKFNTLSGNRFTAENSGGCYYGANDCFYLFGGHYTNTAENLGITRAYSDETGWHFNNVSESLDYLLFDFGVSLVGNKVLLIGGTTVSGARLNTVLCYDISANLLSTLSVNIPTAVSGIACASYRNTTYCFGGEPKSWQYNRQMFGLQEKVQYVVDDGALLITPTMVGNFFKVMDTEKVTTKIGVGKVYKGNAENLGENVEAALYKDGAWTTI